MCALKNKGSKNIYPRIIAINMKYNSTMISLYEGEKNIFMENIWYSNQEMKKFNTIEGQIKYRYKSILSLLKNKRIYLDEIEGFACKGYLPEKCSSGTYVIDDNLIGAFDNVELNDKFNEDQCLTLGIMVAYEFHKNNHVSGYMVNTVNIDEMISVAKYTGISSVNRESSFNALTQKSVAKRFCKKHNKKYEDINLIVAYLGNRITIGAHRKGRVIDVNNIMEGEGPFSPQRSGSIPRTELLKMCFSKNYTYEEMEDFIERKGGCVAYFNNGDFRDLVHNMQKGDETCKLIFNAMAYGICKEIGKYATVLGGEVYSILLTGRITHCKAMVDYIKNRVVHVAPVHVYEGKENLTNLALEVLRIIRGEEKEILYK